MNSGQLTRDKAFSLLVWDVARLTRKAVDASAAEIGLTSAQWLVLSTLARCEKLNAPAPNQAGLAELLELEPITISRQIDRLTASGMIERLPHPTDRRAHLLRLTEKARPVVSQFRDIATRVLHDAMAGVLPEETEALIATLERIRANLTGDADTATTAERAGSRNREGVSA
jgi:MarR family transcriptional regulator for hemolysin